MGLITDFAEELEDLLRRLLRPCRLRRRRRDRSLVVEEDSELGLSSSDELEPDGGGESSLFLRDRPLLGRPTLRRAIPK